MNVFTTCIHIDHDIWLAWNFQKLGWTICHATDDFLPLIPLMTYCDLRHVVPTIKPLTVEEFKQAQFDLFVISSPAVEKEIISLRDQYHPKAKLLYTLGSNWKEYSYLGDKDGHMTHLLTLDIQAMKHCVAQHKAYVLPCTSNNEFYAYRPLTREVWEQKKISSFVRYSEGDQSVWRHAAYADEVANHLRRHGFTFLWHHTERPVPSRGWHDSYYTRNLPPGNSLQEQIAQNIAVAHIKSSEGFGFHIYKSLRMGRPVIAYIDDIRDKTCSAFLLDGITALLGERKHQTAFFRYLVESLNNYQFMAEMSEQAARHLRSVVNEDLYWNRFKNLVESI